MNAQEKHIKEGEYLISSLYEMCEEFSNKHTNPNHILFSLIKTILLFLEKGFGGYWQKNKVVKFFNKEIYPLIEEFSSDRKETDVLALALAQELINIIDIQLKTILIQDEVANPEKYYGDYDLVREIEPDY